MNTFLKNLWLFAGYGAMVIFYLYLMNWSLSWFINFRITYKQRQDQFRKNKPSYDWQEIVAIPVYIITWLPVIVIVLAFIGGILYFLYDLLHMLVNLGG